jgi:hypothetical protein
MTTGSTSVLSPLDAVKDFSDLANGYYLLAGGVVAAVAGLALLLKLAPKIAPLLAILAIAGGGLAIGVEISAYNRINPLLSTYGYGFSGGLTIGYGLYVGIAGGVVAVLGGLAALVRR